jgi:flavin reductase (DIM6/NTAB) family NADH-FMN oxidoreductase RutF
VLKQYGFFGVNVIAADPRDVAERFAGKGGLKGAQRFVGAKWTTLVSGVPLLVGALVTIDCAVEEILERHSHAIVIGRALDVTRSGHSAALAYWQARYVVVDQHQDAARPAEVGPPPAHVPRQPTSRVS